MNYCTARQCKPQLANFGLCFIIKPIFIGFEKIFSQCPLFSWVSTGNKFTGTDRKFMECNIINSALSLLMKHLVIGQRQKAPNFSAFHWSPYSSLVSIGQHFVTTRVVHLPNWTRLCGPCIVVIAGVRF